VALLTVAGLILSRSIGSKRATLDIDIAVFIENWEQFYHLKEELIGIKHFKPTRDIHRLLFQIRLPVDIGPYGGVAEKGDLVEWPPDGSIKIRVTGFRECFQHAIQVKISDKPKLSAAVVSLAGLAIIKLVSWDDTVSATRIGSKMSSRCLANSKQVCKAW